MQTLKNRRDKLYKRDHHSSEYLDVLKKFDQLSSQLFQCYTDDVQANIKSNPAEFWKFAKLNQKSSLYPNEMYLNDTVVSTPCETVELFADFFESNYVIDDEQWTFDDVYMEPNFSKEVNVSLSDIETAIYSLEWMGGIGPDGIPPFVIKMCVEAIIFVI